MPLNHAYRTEEELLAGVRRREQPAFDAFFDRYADGVYGFGLKFSGHPDQAGEILQATLVTALQNVEEVKHAKAVPRWLLRLASSVCLKGRPESGPPGLGEIPLEELTPERKGGVAVPSHDWSLDLDNEARRDEEKRLLKQAVVALPPHYRLVLILREMEEMSNVDVADILQIPISTARMRLSRARLCVRKELTRRLLKGGGNGGVKAS